MAAMPVMTRDPWAWTVDDLDHLPDDDLQYELLDGLLLVSPAPVARHQVISGELFAALRSACPPELYPLMAPVDWRPDRRTSLQPDLLVVPKRMLDVATLTEPVPLVVEVLSPSTRRKDLVTKRSKYEDVGVPSYWVIDPDGPSIVAWELVDGRYRTAGEASGEQKLRLEQPFPITLVPSALLAPYQP